MIKLTSQIVVFLFLVFSPPSHSSDTSNKNTDLPAPTTNQVTINYIQDTARISLSKNQRIAIIPSTKSPNSPLFCLGMDEKDLKDIQKIIGRPLGSADLCSGREQKSGYSAGAMALKITSRFQTNPNTAHQIASSVDAVSKKHKMDPYLVLAIIEAESGFNPRAVSKAGALGLMQPIPRWHQDKMNTLGINKNGLFGVESNITLGVLIFKDYLAAAGGDKQKALQKYNGSVNDKNKSYSKKVMAIYRRLVDNL